MGRSDIFFSFFFFSTTNLFFDVITWEERFSINRIALFNMPFFFKKKLFDFTKPNANVCKWFRDFLSAQVTFILIASHRFFPSQTNHDNRTILVYIWKMIIFLKRGKKWADWMKIEIVCADKKKVDYLSH